jgi:hypothetical protein
MAAAALASIAVLDSKAEASQTGRRAGPCVLVAPSTILDGEIEDLGNRFDTGRRSGEKLQIGGNITDIVLVRNHTDCPVRVQKGFGSEIIEVPPRGSYSGHMWVPWAPQPYSETLGIYFEGRLYFYLWQMSGRLAFRSDATFRRMTNQPDPNYYRNEYGRALSVPGIAQEGGPRVLHIAATAEGKPFFKVEGIGQE